MKKLSVPYVRQNADYLCGPACIEMLVRWRGGEANQNEIAKLVQAAPDHWTDNDLLAAAAQKLGVRASAHDGSSIQEIRDAIYRGAPVVVNYIEQEAGDGHFAVVIGYDGDELILHDPWHGPDFRIAADDFASRWYGADGKHTRWIMMPKL